MTALGVIPWTARAGTWTVVSIGSVGELILGHPRRAWRGKGFWLSHVEPADRDRLVRCLNEAADRERPTVCEYRFADAQGGILWLRSAVTWRPEFPGKVSGFHIDVTAEREARPVVSVLDEQYRYALDVAGVAIWQRGANELDGWMHPAVTALAGLPADARVSFTEWLDRVHPRDRDRSSEHASYACFSGPVTAGAVVPLSRLDYRVRHVDGSIRWLSSTIATVASADGSDVRIFGTIADVTERVRERRARRAAERLYRDVWQSFPGSAAVLDRAGVIVEVNPMWEGLAQQREADHGRVGANYLEAARKAGELGDEFAASTADGISAVLAGTSPQFTQDFASTNSGDEERWYRMRVLPLHRPSRGAIVLHDDITERVVAERATQRHREDLTHMQRLATLGELATSIAHELNQPLAAIMASASTARRILRDRGDVEPLKPVVNDILESAARAADVVRRARAMVRHDTSVLENVSINEVVSAVSRLMASDLVIHQVSLKLELDPNARPVIGDHIQLQQVLLNLLLNSVDALDPLPRERRNVIVSTRQISDKTLELQVRDTGRGIAPEIAARIFEAFVSTKRKGTGLGLAIVRAIVHAHGGEVFAGTSAEGGAAFRVVLTNP
jgi:two-component system, LuxR family, sensor kinase FixL